MTVLALPDDLRNDRIEFVTSRPTGAITAVIERRVTVTAPPIAVSLCDSGDVRILPALVKLLEDRDRAWAAQVMLSALTQREEKIVEAFAGRVHEWWPVLGISAQRRWREWLDTAGPTLRWDPHEKAFRSDA